MKQKFLFDTLPQHPSIAGRDIMTKKYCGGCNKDQAISNYYTTIHRDMFPDGHFHLCKKCIKGMIDENDLESVFRVLRTLNIPYVSDQWERCKRSKTDTFGGYYRFIANSKQYNRLSWDDTKLKTNNQQSDTKTTNETESHIVEEKHYNKKWMGYYAKSDIEYLEEYITNLHNDFKIVTANHKDYAKKIAKASLHMDRCFEDMLAGKSGADKKYKDAKEVFDTLSKSAQFSESQRGQNDVSLGCFGKIFELVERKQYVKEHIPIEPDQIDQMMNDFKTIFRSV